MRALGLTGAGPGRTVRTTGPAKGNPVPDDLLRRDFTAARPNRRWVVDFTYVPTRHGVPRCTAFVTGPVRDVRIVGWATSTRTGRRQRGRRPGTGDPGRESTATAVIPGAWSTTATTDPSHLSIAYTGRLVDEGTGRLGRKPWAPPCAGAAAQAPGKPPASAGPVLVRRPLEGPRRPLEAATARWVNWYNHTRPHLTNDDDLSPAAAEHRHHRRHTTTATTPGRLFWGVRVGLVGLLGRPGAGSCPNLPQRHPGPG